MAWLLMAGMFGIFGRSQELQQLDRAFRTAGLNPRGVSEAVKLTTLKQVKEASPGRTPDLRAYAAAAELIAYCVLGREAFTQSNDADQTESVEARLVDTLETRTRVTLVAMRWNDWSQSSECASHAAELCKNCRDPPLCSRMYARAAKVAEFPCASCDQCCFRLF